MKRYNINKEKKEKQLFFDTKFSSQIYFQIKKFKTLYRFVLNKNISRQQKAKNYSQTKRQSIKPTKKPILRQLKPLI
jgi:hypothetical protein